MRRPPVVLIVVAVLSTGVSVGWAAGSDSESPALHQSASAGGDDPATPEDPVLSSTEQAVEPATVSTDGTELVDHEEAVDDAEGVERAVDSSEDPAAPAIGPASPPHLEEKTAPVAHEPEPVAAPTTTTAPPASVVPAQPAVAFTASQAYGSCDEPVPYDIFSGTADPGSTVTISSPYGSGSTTADGSGHWERKVEFPSAPRGSTFTVTASGIGGSERFDFSVGH